MKLEALVFRLHPGQDLYRSLEEIAQNHSIEAGCVLAVVGSLTHATIRLSNLEMTELDGYFEIVSLSGTISASGRQHLHISISDCKGKTIGGHLKPGCLVHTTVELVLGVLPEMHFKREFDPQSGFPELIAPQS